MAREREKEKEKKSRQRQPTINIVRQTHSVNTLINVEERYCGVVAMVMEVTRKVTHHHARYQVE